MAARPWPGRPGCRRGPCQQCGIGRARDLPNAERLANALYELSLATPIRDRDGAQRWIEHDLPLTITKTEPGRLWFEGDIGPLPVPRTIDQLAQTGWAVTAVLAYARKRWWLVEVGNVYP